MTATAEVARRHPSQTEERRGPENGGAHGKLRKKLPALREALEGRFEPLHALLVSSILAHLDFLDGQIMNLTEAIGEQIIPFEKAAEPLCKLHGAQRRTAEVIIAEIGVDMSVFPTAKQLASWAGQCRRRDDQARAAFTPSQRSECAWERRQRRYTHAGLSAQLILG